VCGGGEGLGGEEGERESRRGEGWARKGGKGEGWVGEGGVYGWAGRRGEWGEGEGGGEVRGGVRGGGGGELGDQGRPQFTAPLVPYRSGEDPGPGRGTQRKKKRKGDGSVSNNKRNGFHESTVRRKALTWPCRTEKKTAPRAGVGKRGLRQKRQEKKCERGKSDSWGGSTLNHTNGFLKAQKFTPANCARRRKKVRVSFCFVKWKKRQGKRSPGGGERKAPPNQQKSQ